LLSGCDSSEPQATYRPATSIEEPELRDTVYTFSVHPLHNPSRLHDVFDPIMEYLSKHIENADFQLEASRNYAAYDKKLYNREASFSLPNPFQTINSLKHGFHVFGKMGDDENFRGIILVRKDRNITQIEQLKGKSISYPAPTALAATMLPQYFLQTHGLNVMTDVKNHYVGSQESSIMNVFLGDVDAAATWPPPWNALRKERPELDQQLEIRWQTQSLPNNGLVVRDDVPAALVQQVADILFNLHTHKEGRHMLERLELSKFEAATDATYQPVVDFIKEFNHTVRPTE
jgi:phosphonate transport system substrate-binding protein